MERITQTGEGRYRLARAGWLASTCLSALIVFPGLGRAQTDPAPLTTPQGGSVAAGTASIAQAPGSTTITQTSNRAVINWQSFDIGSQATVNFVQPSANAIALNRVLAANPSIIAGALSANGQLVLINQSGVVFTKGAQVNAESLLVTTSNITDQNFMAGHMLFTGAPKPGAQIINNGHITVRDAGLAGLVAPQVANNGTITAQLGQVVLAGASAFTLDLYGDRLVSLDVTQAVRAVDVGGKRVPALVTNRGVIIADGGKITLTAQDADALVTQLIDAGGTLRADTVKGQAGNITLDGVGGGITIDGALLARGEQAGTKGGAVQALTTGTISLTPTARLDVSGQAGGGVAAIGTDLARATTGPSDKTAPRAAAVSIAAGALIDATALHQGDAGRVVLLSTQHTDFSGTILAQGGSLSGNGGTVELSSDGVVALTGTVLDTAAHGQAGQILLDPATLVVNVSGVPTTGSTLGPGGQTFGTDNSATSYITPSALAGLSGTIVLEASSLLSVASAISMNSAAALSLISGGDVSITAPISLSAGSLVITATGTLNDAAELDAQDIELLDSNLAGGVTLAAPINDPGGTFALISDGFAIVGGTVNATGGVIESAPYTATLAGLQFPQAILNLFTANTLIIGQAGSFSANNLSSTNNLSYSGTLIFHANDEMIQSGTLTADNIVLQAASLAVEGSLTANTAISLSGSSVFVDTGTIAAPLVALTGAGLQQSGAGAVIADTLQGQASSTVLLTGTGTSISNLNAFTVSGASFELVDQQSLNVTGVVYANNIAVSDSAGGGIFLASVGGLSAASGGTIDVIADAFSLSNGALFSAPAGVMGITPYTTTRGIDLGGGDDGLLDLSGDLIEAANARILEIGTGNAGIVTRNDVTASAATVLLNGSSIDFERAFTAPGLLELAVPTGQLGFSLVNGITQSSSGTVTAGTLFGLGTVGGPVDLGQAQNVIGTLANFDATGANFALTDSGPLLVAGALLAQSASLQAGALTMAGSISTTTDLALTATTDTFTGTANLGGRLSLQTSGIFDELPTAGITAASLLGVGSSGATTLAGTNAISSLGSFSGTSLDLVDTTALAVTGPVSVQTGTFTLGGLNLEGDLTASTALTLATASGGLTQTSGALVTPTLALAAATAVSLSDSANEINTLTSASLTSGALNLTDDSALTIAGPLHAAALTLTVSGLNITGAVSLAGGFTLDSVGLAQETGAGAVTATSLTSTGGSLTAGLNFGGANNIATLANIALTSGTLALTDSAALTLAGTISAPTLALTAFALAEAGGAQINTAFFTGSATSGIALASQLNSIASLGSVNAGTGDLTLADLTGLTITAPVTARNFTLTDSAPQGIALTSTGSLTAATNSTISVTTDALTAQAGAAILAAGGRITLAPDTSTLAIALGGANTGTLDLSATLLSATSTGLLQIGTGGGAITAQNSVAITATTLALNGTSLGFNGQLSTAGVLSLTSTGAVTQAVNAGITATALAGSISSGDIALTGNNNRVSTLSGFTVTTGNFSLNDTNSLIAAGPLSASNVTLSGPQLSFTGTLLTPGTLTVNTASITESGATISAGTLTGTVAGDAALTGTANSIASLANFTAGSLELTDQPALQTGLVSLTSGVLTAPNITLAGNLFAGALTFATSGSITQTAGTLTAATLSGGSAASGAITLLDAGNNLATLGGFSLSTGNALSLTDAAGLTITGPLTADTIALTAASMTLEGNVTGSHVQLESTNGITQAAGTLGATLLTNGGIGGGTVALTSSGNSIASISNFVLPGGEFLLDDATALSLSGVLSAALASLTAPSLALEGLLTATTLTISSPGGISESGGGVFNAGTLTGSFGAAASIADANSLATLAALTVTGGLNLQDMAALNITGPVAASGDITIAAAAISLTGSLLTPGAISLDDASMVITGYASAGTSLNLTSALGLDESLGTLTAQTLTGAVTGGNAQLTGTNNIGTLGAFTVTGGALNFNDTTALIVAGPITAGGISLDAASLNLPGSAVSTGAATLTGATGIALSGDLAANSQITLTAHGPITGNGTLTGIAFTGTDTAGGIALTGPNSVLILDNLSATGGITFNNATALDVSGPVTGASIDLTAPSLTVAGIAYASGNITLGGGSIALGGLVETGATLTLDGTGVSAPGTIIAPSLAGTESGYVALTGSNTIASIQTLTDSAAFSLIDTAPLTIAGNLTAPDISLTAPSLTLTGLTDAAGLLDVTAANLIEPGTVTAGTLTGAVGDVDLTGSNRISVLNNFTASSEFALIDGANLSIAGNFISPDIELTAPTITLGGTVAAASALSLGGAALFETTGTLITAILTGSETGGVALTGANSITTLSDFTAASLAITDSAPLTVSGNVTATQISLSAPSLTATGSLSATGTVGLTGTSGIALEDDVTAATLNLSSQGDVTETNATLTATTLSGSVLGNTGLTGPTNSFAFLGAFSGGALSLTDQRALSLGAANLAAATLNAPGLVFTGAFGAVALSLASAGAVTESGAGVLTTGVLNADTGQISLGGANTITTIASLTSAGAVAITGAASLTGPLTATSASFTNGGNFTLASTAIVPGALSITAGGTTSLSGSVTAGSETITAAALTLTGTDSVTSTLSLVSGSTIAAPGSLTAATLTGAADGLVLFTGGAAFNTLGAFTDSAGIFSLSNTGDLTLTGPLTAAAISLATTGALTLDGNVTLASPSSLTASSISQTGSTSINSSAGTTVFFNAADGAHFAGLQAPQIATVFTLGTGALTGIMDIGKLDIISASSASLTGSIGGTTGPAAAAKGTLAFAPAANYLFNTCVIAATTCTLQTTTTTPTTPAVIVSTVQSAPTVVFDNAITATAAATTAAATAPLANFTTSAAKTSTVVLNITPPETPSTTRRKRRLNNNVQLPGIATHDY